MSNEKNLSVLNPNLTDVVNMNLTKKDIMEILEVEAEEQLTDIVNLRETEFNKALENYNKCNEKLVQFKKQLTDKVISDKENELKQIKSILDGITLSLYAKIIYNYVVNNDIVSFTEKPEIKICIELGNKSSSRMMLTKDRLVKVSSKDSRKLLNILKELNKLSNEKYKCDTKLYSAKRNLWSLPKKLKEMSAEISRSALNSNVKGKEVLKLLQSIRQTSKKVGKK